MTKSLLLFISLLVWLGCITTEPNPTVKGVAFGGPLIQTVVIDGVGPAIIADSTIYVRLPSSYTATTFKLTYTGSAERITPAPGTSLAVNSPSPPPVCASSSKNGPCEEVYTLDVQRVKPFMARAEQAQVTATLAEPDQRLTLRFALDTTLSVRGPAQRTVAVLLRNKATQETISVPPTLLFYDKMPGRFQQSNVQFELPLPRSVKAGEYAVALQSKLVFIHNNGALRQEMPIETLELPTNVVLNPGIPTITDAQLSPAGTLLTLKGGYLTPTKAVQVRLENDFVTPIQQTATVLTDSTAQVTLTSALPDGQYSLTVTPVGGSKPYNQRLVWSANNPTPYTIQMAIDAKQNPFPIGASSGSVRVKSGERISMILTGSDYPMMSTRQKMPFAVRLISLTPAKTVYDLTNGASDSRFAIAGISGWQYTVPANVPKGDYQLVYDFTENGPRSLPFYRKVVVEY